MILSRPGLGKSSKTPVTDSKEPSFTYASKYAISLMQQYLSQSVQALTTAFESKGSLQHPIEWPLEPKSYNLAQAET